MSMIDSDQKLIVPLLDRLLDDNPDQPQERERAQHLLIHQLKESVRRDIEAVFNSRQCCIAPPEQLTESQNALHNYGLPDAATMNLGSQKARQEFCRLVEDTIKRFEPRIRSVKVTTKSGFDPEDPSIRFRVEATLYALSADELIVFDSALNPVTRSVTVSETA
jgi:type VI secretion system protein ImpF